MLMLMLEDTAGDVPGLMRNDAFSCESAEAVAIVFRDRSIADTSAGLFRPSERVGESNYMKADTRYCECPWFPERRNRERKMDTATRL